MNTRRELSALVQQLAGLGPTLSAGSLIVASAAQFDAACMAIHGCAWLAGHLQHNATFRLASSLAMVFGTGPAVLHVRIAQVSASGEAALFECNRQLNTVLKTLQCAAHPKQQPEAAAAFVRTAGRPQAVLAWLLAISQALLAVPPETEKGEAVPPQADTMLLMWHDVRLHGVTGFDSVHDVARSPAPSCVPTCLQVPTSLTWAYTP